MLQVKQISLAQLEAQVTNRASAPRIDKGQLPKSEVFSKIFERLKMTLMRKIRSMWARKRLMLRVSTLALTLPPGLWSKSERSQQLEVESVLEAVSVLVVVLEVELEEESVVVFENQHKWNLLRINLFKMALQPLTMGLQGVRSITIQYVQIWVFLKPKKATNRQFPVIIIIVYRRSKQTECNKITHAQVQACKKKAPPCWKNRKPSVCLAKSQFRRKQITDPWYLQQMQVF